MKMRTKI